MSLFLWEIALKPFFVAEITNLSSGRFEEMTNLYFPFDSLLTIRFAEGSSSSPSSSTSVTSGDDLEGLSFCAASTFAAAAASVVARVASAAFFVASSNAWAVVAAVAVVVARQPRSTVLLPVIASELMIRRS